METMLAIFVMAGGSLVAADMSFGISIGPPPPVVVPASPGPGYVWVNGYWYPEGHRYHWHAGYWARPPYGGAYWVEPRHDGERYYNGHWEGEHGRREHDHHWDRDRDRDYNRH
jgi:hypothetical protein